MDAVRMKSPQALGPVDSPRWNLDRLLARVDEQLATHVAGERARWDTVDSRAPILLEAMAELIEAGGKRLRPAFCLSGYLAAGSGRDDDAVRAAAALEVLH